MSPSLEKQYSIVNAEMRSLYFKANGVYGSDDQVFNWYHSIEANENTTVSTGGKTDFYDIKGCLDVDDLAEHWGLKGDEFNCLKAIVGIAKGSRHAGTSPKRDANKLLHYAQRIVNRLNKDSK